MVVGFLKLDAHLSSVRGPDTSYYIATPKGPQGHGRTEPRGPYGQSRPSRPLARLKFDMEDHAAKVKKFRELAAEARLRAVNIRQPEIRATFLEIALSYTNLAAIIERTMEHERSLEMLRSEVRLARTKMST